LNLIYFINDDWDPKYGGSLNLWTPTMSKCVEKIFPKYNRCALFRTSDNSWHEVSFVKCPEDKSRKTIAYYYLSETGIKKKEELYRKKAKFIKNPNTPFDERMKKLYDIRPIRRITKEDMDELFPEGWSPDNDADICPRD